MPLRIAGLAAAGSATSELAFVAGSPAPGRRRNSSLPLQILLEPSLPLEGRVSTLSFLLDDYDLALAVSLGARPDIDVVGAGRIVAGRVVGRLIDPRELFEENLRERPVLTGVAVAGALGAYVGWESLNDGRLSGSYSFGLADARISLSGWYDLDSRDWAGRVRVDLSRAIRGF
ncbi:MAG TPA: hypothetical protein DFS52_02690 [Myxococcales bacterium]|nr:hypothetical protein [Myxococcales bacterium]